MVAKAQGRRRTPAKKVKSKKETPSASTSFSKLSLIVGILLGVAGLYIGQNTLSLPAVKNFQWDSTEKTTPPTVKPKISKASSVEFDYPHELTREEPVGDYEPPKVQAKSKPKPANLKQQNKASKAERPKVTQPKPKAPRHKTSVNRVIQVGSFKSFKDADSVKAKLAFMGIEAGIQKIYLNRNTLWHRVRITHFKDLNEFNRIKKRLEAAGFEPFSFKMKR